MKILLKTLLYLISFPVLSRIWGMLARFKHPRFLVKKIIRLYKNHYKIDMNEYLGDIESDFSSLSEFFIRKLNPETRPLQRDEKYIVSPADGTLLDLQVVHEDSVTQVKGIEYKISELINRKLDFQRGWLVANVYLSPSDYHRYHFPLSAELEEYCHLKGRLYPVNSLGLQYVKKLFLRNERISVKFSKNSHPFYMVSIGATFVGSIKMEFIKAVARDGKWKKMNLESVQLEEMGRFEIGSSIVLICPVDLADPVSGIEDSRVKVGQPIFKYR